MSLLLKCLYYVSFMIFSGTYIIMLWFLPYIPVTYIDDLHVDAFRRLQG
jgi:hypothetical protein